MSPDKRSVPIRALHVIVPITLALILTSAGCNSRVQPKGWGKFEGTPVASWEADGRNMTLQAEFAYVDSRGKRWVAPKNSVVNGASIPQVFWSLIGGPFEGQYRNASIVHDVYCESMSEPCESVHRMFYEACRCGGVSESKAKALYFAVARFGPQWMIDQQTDASGKPVPQIYATMAPPTKEDAQRIMHYFESHNPNLDEIPTLQID